MKSVFALLSLLLISAACSSSNDNNPALTPFQKASGGVWLSACQQDNDGNFKETLSLQGSSGTTTNQYFQNHNCTGNVVKTDGPTSFAYTSTAKAGGNDGEATVTINLPGKGPVSLEVIVQGDTMSVNGPNGTVLYTRIAGGPGKQGTPGTPAAAFDQKAKGSWALRDCKQVNANTSLVIVLTIQGGGNGQQVFNVYGTPNCTGAATPQNNTAFTYTVDRFANNGGQVTINAQPLDVTFQGNQMSVSSVNGTEVYIKIR